MNLSLRCRTGKRPISARFLALGLALAAVSLGQAATLDADAAVALALQQADVRAAEQARIAIAGSAVLAAKAWPNPELRLEQERGRGDLSGNDETGLMLAQTWDISGRRGLDRQAADVAVSAAEADAAAMRIGIRRTVLEHFHAAIAAEARAAAAGERLAALQRLAAIAARRSEAGDLSGFASQRIALLAQRGVLDREGLEAMRQASRERLAAWVGPVAREAALLPAALASPADMASTGSATNAEHRALQRRVDAAEAAERAALRWRLPLSLGIGQKRIDTPGGRDQALLVEAAIPLPLFDRNQAEVQRASAEAELARAQLAASTREMAARVASVALVARQLVASAQRYQDELVPSARRLSAIATRSFADGELDLIGLLETLDGEAEAVEQAIDLHHRAQIALVELDTLTAGDTP